MSEHYLHHLLSATHDLLYACVRRSIYIVLAVGSPGAWFLVGFGGGVPSVAVPAARRRKRVRQEVRTGQAEGEISRRHAPSLSEPGGAVGPAVHSRLSSVFVIILFSLSMCYCRCWYVSCLFYRMLASFGTVQ